MNKNYLPWRIFQYLFRNNKIHPTAYIHHKVWFGYNNKVYPYAAIGTDAEHKNPERMSRVTRIYNNNVIREHVTINSGTTDSTVIFYNCYIMTKAHVGHDSIVNNDVVLSSGCSVGGHSVIGAGSYIGLNATTHQRSNFPGHSILGASSFFKGSGENNSKYAGCPARRLGENIRSK